MAGGAERRYRGSAGRAANTCEWQGHKGGRWLREGRAATLVCATAVPGMSGNMLQRLVPHPSLSPITPACFLPRDLCCRP